MLLLLLIISFLNINSQIVLDSNNVLQNLLIFFKNDVPERNGTLLSNIKMYITETSKALWKATSNMHTSKVGVQFGKVFILIPNVWKYIEKKPIIWQKCYKADIIITTRKENNNEDEPITEQTGACGEPGQFIRIPHTFIINKTDEQIRIKGKKIMTEFIKLRYGVFSEKPYKNQLTVYNGFSFTQSSCSSDIKWKLSDAPEKCSETDNNCTFVIDPNQHHNFSVMFDQSSNSTEFFCDDHYRPHNTLAKSLQNIKCNMRSITNVILAHSDFQGNNKGSSKFIPPSFTIIKNYCKNIVRVFYTHHKKTIDSNGLKIKKFQNPNKAATEINIFIADEFMGINLYVTITFNKDISTFDIKLVDPLNKVYSNTSSIKQGSMTTLAFQIPGKIAPGMYFLKLTPLTAQSSTKGLNLRNSISASLDPNAQRFINPSGDLDKSEIDLVNDFTKVSATVDMTTCAIEPTEKVIVKLSMYHYNQIIIEREMLDNGLACDSIEDDQLYSACIYPNDLKTINYYSVVAKIKIFRQRRPFPIERDVNIGTIRVKMVSPVIRDKIPPAKILELRLSAISQIKRILHIDSIATGDDGIMGNISRYQIEVRTNVKSIVEVKYISLPLERISFEVDLYHLTSNKPFSLAIRGVDESGNYGQWSPSTRFRFKYDPKVVTKSNLIITSTTKPTIRTVTKPIITPTIKPITPTIRPIKPTTTTTSNPFITSTFSTTTKPCRLDKTSSKNVFNRLFIILSIFNCQLYFH